MKNIHFKRSKFAIYQFLENWFICFSNFIYPLLIVFDSPIYFLAGILLYTLFQVFVSFKGVSLNKKILSLYPFIFHVCFIIFYWITDLMMIQIACLLILLIGSVHYLLYEFILVAKIIFVLAKRYIFNNSVTPTFANLK